MSHPAELAAERMEKKGIAFTTAALLTLAAAPAVTAGLNWMTGHDPRKKIRQAALAQRKRDAESPAAPPETPPKLPPRFSFNPMSRLMMPHGGPMLLQPAQGLHRYRMGM
jgi:hypothetical protein